jgi:hypothetical protein
MKSTWMACSLCGCGLEEGISWVAELQSDIIVYCKSFCLFVFFLRQASDVCGQTGVRGQR